MARIILLSLVLFNIFSFGELPAQSRKNTAHPVKLLLQCKTEIGLDETDSLKVILANNDNEAVPSASDLSVQIKVLWENGNQSDFSLSIKHGESFAILPVEMSSAGICEIQATEPHFLSASAFVVVGYSKSIKKTRQIKIKTRGGPNHIVEVKIPTRDTINIRYDSSRAFIADGKDSAQISVILNRNASSDIQIDLFTSVQTLRVTIPKGRRIVQAKIASGKSGRITIQEVSSDPELPVKWNPFSFRFVQPIAKINCVASPPNISLIENAEIVITLLDAEGHPHATLIPRTVAFQIDKGRGEMETSEITIPAGSFVGRTHFRPTILGGINILGAMDELEMANASLSVSLPVWVLLLSILGGIAGGFIAKLRNNYEKWRVLIGTITGFLLYWSFIMGLLQVLPHDIVLNPFSAFAISTLGGWMGTEVFSTLLSRFGLVKKTAS